MDKAFLVFSCSLMLYSMIYAQSPVRYRDDLFQEIKELKNVRYRPGTETERYLLDIYSPASDSELNRPLMIWMHGGGFKFGSKTSRGIPGWCRQFAIKGYVCVGLNYSLSREKTLTDPKAFIRGCQTAVTDLLSAINFLQTNAEKYGIDPSRVILAGNSAGGTMALQAAYGVPNGFINTLGAGPAGSANLGVVAVVNYWGAITDSSWLSTQKIPIFSALGENDRVLSPRTNDGFMFGGITIHEIAERLGTPNRLKIYQGLGHELQRHFIPFFAGTSVRKRWKELGDLTAQFLFEQVLEK